MNSRGPSDEIEVPPYFLCPISLQLMRDPVTVSTGITYDRQSIEKWFLCGSGANTCPVTRQELASDTNHLTPNHTLRRLIQSWCTLDAPQGGAGIELSPSPKLPATHSQIHELLSRAAAEQPAALLKCLRSLRSIASESDANKRCIEAAGAIEFLASVVIDAAEKLRSNDDSGIDDVGHDYTCRARDEAIAVLCHLKVSDSSLRKLLGTNGGESRNKYVDSLVNVLQQGSYDARANVILLLKQLIFSVADPTRLARFGVELLEETVQLLRDQVSQQASKAALDVLVQLCSCGRNLVNAVEAGAVAVTLEILLECGADKRACEMSMVLLEQLCGCAEGRAELLGHDAGLAVVSKKMLRVSELATERAVRVLMAVSRFSASPAVVTEMAEVGVVAKLCLVLQVGCARRTKEKAGEILRAHARVWRHSPCVPTALLSR